MIVRAHLKGWEIVSHYTHGLLAGKIAMQLDQGSRTAFWEDVLTAIIEHDDYLLDFKQKNYLNEAGAPLDFTLDERSLDDAKDHAEKVYENALQKSQMVALMVGRHLEFLYGDKAGGHKGFKKFFLMVKKRRKNQLKIYGWKTKKLETSYAVMRFCDRCSLVLCQGLVPPTGRKLEINKTIGGKRYFIYLEDNMVTVEPWPFEQDFFEVHYEKKIVGQGVFKDNSELESVIQGTLPELVSVKFSK